MGPFRDSVSRPSSRTSSVWKAHIYPLETARARQPHADRLSSRTYLPLAPAGASLALCSSLFSLSPSLDWRRASGRSAKRRRPPAAGRLPPPSGTQRGTQRRGGQRPYREPQQPRLAQRNPARNKRREKKNENFAAAPAIPGGSSSPRRPPFFSALFPPGNLRNVLWLPTQLQPACLHRSS